ncbi:MAG: hypothetical protein PHS73_02155, partial [Candidatus Peribacteraceae bacterium]|nr:hypothetical protein [Candidatus Peribacteraceae bacterium]
MTARRLLWLWIFLLTCGIPFQPLAAQELPSEELLRAEVLNVRGGERQTIRLRIVTGMDAGAEITVEQNRQQRWQIEEGEKVAVRKLIKTDASIEYMIAETYRLPALLWIGLLFAGLAVLLGGRKGVGAITGLCLSIGILVFFVVPKIAEGNDPV